MELSPLARKAKQHWKEFRPTLYKELEADGTLEQALENAAQQTLNEIDELMNAGMFDYEAEEIVYPKYILLRDENENQELPKGERPNLDSLQEGHELMSRIRNET